MKMKNYFENIGRQKRCALDVALFYDHCRA